MARISESEISAFIRFVNSLRVQFGLSVERDEAFPAVISDQLAAAFANFQRAENMRRGNKNGA